jgi:serine/threonine protein kinase
LGIRDNSNSGSVYFLKEHIGQGGYGSVYKACKLEETKDYAIKFLKFNDSSKSNQAKLAREIENLKNAENAGGKST